MIKSIVGCLSMCFALTLVGANARTLEEVKAMGSVLVCASPEALPYASNKSGAPGFQIELAQEIAKGLGVSLSMEWILPRRRANVVNCDLQFDAISDPEKRTKGKHRQSQPYNVSGVVLGLAANSVLKTPQVEALQGQRVGVMINSTAAEYLGKAGAALVPYAFQSDMIEELAKGELYAGAVSTASLSYFVMQNPQSGIKMVDMFDQASGLSWNVAVNIRNTDAALVQAIDSVLDQLMSSGKLADIYSHYGIVWRKP
jgi:polar amino acid transport system substrate-binding protein